ncbi:hypothetical protein [Bacillus sp. SORGH_AS_0510]|uniref:hypothetical protein n=1 Tax=Bacillus sp. SORGH_AS_0510 TaxID=3041771 RepID=UPI0027D88176|nr:hypothetical protein [Bacillus sp. SORGH_AS_0510]
MCNDERQFSGNQEILSFMKRMKDNLVIPEEDFVLHKVDEGQFVGSQSELCSS